MEDTDKKSLEGNAHHSPSRVEKIHDYLGMTLDFTEDGIVKIDMREYVEKVLGEIPDEMDGTATSPAASQLFQMRGDAIALENKRKISFTPQWQSSFYYANAVCMSGRPRLHRKRSFATVV